MTGDISTGQQVLPAFADPTPDRTLTLDERYTQWAEANPWVLDQIERFADELAAAGVKRIGIKALVERLRWDWTISRATTGDRWKLNNSFTSRLARALIARRPDLAPMIETRRLKT